MIGNKELFRFLFINLIWLLHNYLYAQFYATFQIVLNASFKIILLD